MLRAPEDGIFRTVLDIGAQVKSGDVAGQVNGKPMLCTIDGVLRGLLADGTPVHKGMKSGDVDPRCKEEYCYTASDKALAVGGGVLEAVLHFYGEDENQARTEPDFLLGCLKHCKFFIRFEQWDIRKSCGIITVTLNVGDIPYKCDNSL